MPSTPLRISCFDLRSDCAKLVGGLPSLDDADRIRFDGPHISSLSLPTPRTVPTDDRTRVFPARTAAKGPESIAALRKEHIREALAGKQSLIAAYVSAQFLMPLMLFGLGFPPPVGLACAGILLLIPLVFYAVQAGQAERQFWAEYAETRGLRHRDSGALHSDCPLYACGDRQRFEHLMSGPIGATEATLAHFIYTEEHRDSKGRKSSTDYPHTVVQFRLPTAVAQRYRGVYLRPRSFSLGKLQDYFAHDRGVQLSSVEFDQLYSLRVVDEQDDVALFELFSTTFIDDLIREFHATWEQRAEDLVVFTPHRLDTAADLDQFCSSATRVLERYLEEHR